MNKKTLRALKDSIVKWENIVECIEGGEGFLSPDQYNCPLCKLYYDYVGFSVIESGCKGCPVSEKSGVGNCDKTPYQKEWFGNYDLIAAQHEVKFLKSLMPKTKEKKCK